MKNWITGIISITAIIFAIIALANVAPTHGIDFDYMGVIIGVLSFLVTRCQGGQVSGMRKLIPQRIVYS